MNLFELPSELFENVLAYLQPPDIVHLRQTSKIAQDAIQLTNSLVWRTAFLHIFDDPQHAVNLTEVIATPIQVDGGNSDRYWYDQVERRFAALKAIGPYATGPYENYGLSAENVISTILEIIDTAKTGPTPTEIERGVWPQVDDRRSLNLELLSPRYNPWSRLENLIHDCHTRVTDKSESDLETERSFGKPITRSVSQARREGQRSDAASRLHVLYGRTTRERIERGARASSRQVVYDWTDRIQANDYGPFKTDGSGEPDWRVLEAVMSVMLPHFELSADGRIAIPQGFYYSIPHRTLADPTVPDDWARVSGSWNGTYSFLDYADIFAFNTNRRSRWSLEDIDEAHGDLMVLELELDINLRTDPRLQTKLPYNDAYPPLYFSGISRSFDLHGMDIRVIGSAALCPNGREVRWRFIISYRSQEQWQLEGVQPGGVKSGPVYGVWSQWGHDELSPVGAFLYVPEELCKGQELVLMR